MKRIVKIGGAVVSLALVGFLGVQLSHAGDGKATYTAKCVACHGADAKGKPTMAGTNLIEGKGNCPDVVKKGSENKKMPGFEGKLTDADITDVCAYIKTLK